MNAGEPWRTLAGFRGAAEFCTRIGMVNTASPANQLHRLAGRFLDAVLPPQCLGCGALVSDAGTLCADCWEHIDFLGPPQCASCGHPFEYEAGDGALCAACAATPPLYDRARSVFRYDEHSRGLILKFKHADRTHSAPAFGRWLVRAGDELLREADFLAPVPLHRWRLFQRRYNQAALLTCAVAKQAGGNIKLSPDLLHRRRRTPPQGRLSRAERMRNMAGAFVVRPGWRARIKGKRVLLVDDVLTTGATATACTRALLDSGARAVDVLTLARVVHT
jgi:ComF family protein